MPSAASGQMTNETYPSPSSGSTGTRGSGPRMPVPGRFGAPLANTPLQPSTGTGTDTFEEGKLQQQKLQQQSQQMNASRAAINSANAAADATQQAQRVDAYRRARDTGTGRDNLNTSAQQRQMATSLGIDPSSDAATIASAASGPIHVGADGRMAGGDTGNETVTTPGDVRNAVLNVQAQKDGAQRTANDNSYAQGRTGSSTGTDPFDASKTPNAPVAPPAGSVPDQETADTSTDDTPGTPAAPVVYNPGKALRKKAPTAGGAVTPPTS